MWTSAQAIIDQAPLGAIIRFSDGTPKPPARFVRKLRTWENHNGVGRLIERHRACDGRPGDFKLHLGDFGGEGIVVLSVRRVFQAGSSAAFTIDQVPEPGQATIVNAFNGRIELLHLASSEAAAIAWLGRHHYAHARIEVVATATEPASAEVADPTMVVSSGNPAPADGLC